MSHAPAISVVMSVYNGEEYLAEAVESILGQTFADFEFIIVDDGSKDRTAEMLAEYAARDERIRAVKQENRGRVPSLNRGIEMARGDLIARMDADDVAMSERFERQAAFMAAYPEIGLLGTGVEEVTPEGTAMGVYVPPTGDREVRKVMLRENPFRHSTIMMRREIAVAAGLYRKPLLDADDYDLWLRIGERCQMANLPDALARYRFHAKQVSVTNMAHQIICCRAAQIAAERRKAGLKDPLDETAEITPDFVRGLGVSDEEIRREVAAVHCFWMGIFAKFRPEEALRMALNLLQMRRSGAIPRRYLADAFFLAARIYMRQGRVTRALTLAARGIVTQPMVAARVATMAVARRVRDLNARTVRGSAA